MIFLQEVGWRNGSLRIVMVLTDAGFKTALDGRVYTLLLIAGGNVTLSE